MIQSHLKVRLIINLRGEGEQFQWLFCFRMGEGVAGGLDAHLVEEPLVVMRPRNVWELDPLQILRELIFISYSHDLGVGGGGEGEVIIVCVLCASHPLKN